MEVLEPSPLVKEKTNWGKVPCSTFIILHKLSLISFSCFFRIAFTGKNFCERALAFVKRTSKKAFCSCLHTPRAFISGIASSLVKLFNPSLSVFCSFRSISNLFLVGLLQNLEHFLCLSIYEAVFSAVHHMS